MRIIRSRHSDLIVRTNLSTKAFRFGDRAGSFSDFATFAPLTVNPESVSVVDGSICFEFAPTGNAAFFRFSVQ
ncbi:MAG: hypothetical protein VCA38_06885 [Roseibacillus sp.]